MDAGGGLRLRKATLNSTLRQEPPEPLTTAIRTASNHLPFLTRQKGVFVCRRAGLFGISRVLGGALTARSRSWEVEIGQ